MHFSPNRNDKVPNDGTKLLTLNGLIIKHVKETKFLGVIQGTSRPPLGGGALPPP